MPFIPAGGLVAKAAVEYRQFGNQIVNTLWFEKIDEAEWTSAELALLNAGIGQWVEDDLIPLLSQELTLFRITSRRWATADDFYAEQSFSGIAGADAGLALPTSNCISVKFASSLTGRNWRGRNYVAGLTSTDTNDNEIIEPFRAGLIAAYELLNTKVQENVAAQHVIVSFYSDNAPRLTGQTVPVVSYNVVDLHIDSQRPRLNSRGV